MDSIIITNYQHLNFQVTSMLPGFSHSPCTSLPKPSSNIIPQCQPSPSQQHRGQVVLPSNSKEDKDCKQEKALLDGSQDELTKVSREAFIKYQKRKLKQLYPIFVQRELELVAKRMWDELTEEEKEIHQRKNKSNFDFDVHQSTENQHTKMKIRSYQNLESFSSEEICNNYETQTKNQNAIEQIFLSKCPIKGDQSEKASQNSPKLDPLCPLNNNSENENAIFSQEDQNNLGSLQAQAQNTNNNGQIVERDILDFQESSILENEEQPPNLQTQSNGQLDESLQNDTKTSSAIYENSNHGVVGTFETFTLVSLAQVYRSEADQPQSIGNGSLTSDLRSTQKKSSESIEKEDEPGKVAEGNKASKAKDRFLCDNQDIQNVDQAKNTLNQPK